MGSGIVCYANVCVLFLGLVWWWLVGGQMTYFVVGVVVFAPRSGELGRMGWWS